MEKLQKAKGKKVNAKAKKRKVEGNKEAKVGSNKSNSKANDLHKRTISSKGSTRDPVVDLDKVPEVLSKGNDLVEKHVLSTLSQPCFWLHKCVSNLQENKAIQVSLDKSQFNYMVDSSTWVNKDDVSEFLSGKMLNVSIIQVFMR